MSKSPASRTLAILASFGVVASALVLAAPAAFADTNGMRITEYEYNGSEFVEFTNLGSTPVDMTGWSFSDNHEIAGNVPLSSFATVAVGESVILSQATADNFRTQWGLPESVKVIGSNSQNLGRSDEINLYDNTGALVDRLTFNDQGSGSVKADRKSVV